MSSAGKRKAGELAAALSILILLMGAPPAGAQIDTGRIVGTVQDQSGAVVPNAQVTLKNEGTALVLTTQTTATGVYVFAGLKVGTYLLEVELAGFQKFARPGLPVHVQRDLTIDVILVPGQVTQTTTVTGVAPLLQAEDASMGQTIGNREVTDLPLYGRNWISLAQLSVGVATMNGDTPQGYYFSTNGVSHLQNDFRLNGINNNNEAYTYRTVYSVLPPPDAVQEFKVETGNYSAEFGHSGGAIVNASIKSGSNEVHGSAWEFLRNDKLSTSQFFENARGVTKGAYRQNQFGFAVGGPVFLPHVYNGRNKTFFFFDYQGGRVRQASPTTGTVPTVAMRQSGYTNLQDLITYSAGIRSDVLGRQFPLGTVLDPATTRSVTAGTVDPVTGLKAATDGLVRDPFYTGSLGGLTDFTNAAIKSRLNLLPAGRLGSNAIKLLNLYPAANLPGVASNFSYSPSLQDGTNQFDLRLDHNFSSRDQIFGVIDWSHQLVVQPNILPGLATGGTFGTGNTDLPHQMYAISYSHVFSPSAVNELRVGYNRNTGNTAAFEANQMGIPAQFGIQGIPQVPNNGGLPVINMAGLTSLGVSGYMPTLSISQVKEFSDNFNKMHGGHAFKTGVLVNRIRAAVTQPPAGRGNFSFSGTYTDVPYQSSGLTGIAQLLLSPTASTVAGGYNNVGGATSLSVSNFANNDITRGYYGIYFQDDWKVTPRLTLNLGVRWDYFSPYNEKYGAQANFIPGSPGVAAQYLIPQSRCNQPRSATFDALMKQDGISIACSDNAALGNAQKTNFAPRVGFAYRVSDKFVVRGGYAISYGALASIGYGPTIGNNYPFIYSFSFPNPDAAHPVTFSDGSIATLENGLLGVPLTPTQVKGNGLTLRGRQYNFSTPAFQSFNFTLQYQVTANQSVQLAYVGTLGTHLDIFPGTNRSSVILPPSVNEQNYVPHPDFARNASYEATAGTSNSNAFQATFERRFSGGLNMLANYAFSKCLTNFLPAGGTGGTAGSYRAYYLPGFGRRGDYQLCDFDATSVIHSAASYELPIGKGKMLLHNSGKLVNAVAGGWKMNYMLTLQGGQPFSVGCPVATTSNFGCYALLVPGQDMYAGRHNVDQWLNPAAFSQPPVAKQIGQTDYSPLGGAPTQARGPALHRMDFSLFKQFPIRERSRLEFRAEAFNLTNTPAFAQPAYRDFTNTVTFGRITSVRNPATDPRQIQFALKLYW